MRIDSDPIRLLPYEQQAGEDRANEQAIADGPQYQSLANGPAREGISP